MSKWEPSQHLEGLKGEIEGLERVRRDVLATNAKGRVMMFYCVLGSLGFGALMAALSGNGALIFLGIPCLVISGACVYYQYFSKGRARYNSMFKVGLIEPLVKAVEPGMNYDPGNGISEDMFSMAGLFSRPDRYRSEDLFHGMIGKTQVMFSEVHAERKHTSTDSKGRRKTTWSTIFRGVFLIADFHKEFRSPVSVMPDFAERSLGWFGKKLQKLGGSLQRMENPEFEKLFVVRGADPVETRYILTPRMQECLVELHRRVGEGVCVGFRDSNVVLAIPNSTNLFESNLKVPAADRRQLEGLLFDLWNCFRIVEDLDLNTRIWTKE
ncbi:DUF3137 domain-containing protein [Verrucomicrobiaceae bacterium 227]